MNDLLSWATTGVGVIAWLGSLEWRIRNTKELTDTQHAETLRAIERLDRKVEALTSYLLSHHKAH